MRAACCVVLLLVVAGSSALATTKGLNQIITPDLQPPGQLSLSFQQQHPGIGNASEFQIELGLCKHAEIAVFRGFEPGQTILGFETGLQKGPYLVSAGFANWSPGGAHHSDPQPFAEFGYYRKQHEAIAGAIDTGHETQAILGYACRMTPRLQWQTDWQSGSGNSVTFGLTYNVTNNLSFNPSIYVTNDAPHSVLGYGVLSWTIKAF